MSAHHPAAQHHPAAGPPAPARRRAGRSSYTTRSAAAPSSSRGRPSQRRAPQVAADSASTGGSPARTSSATSSATRPCGSEPPASVPAKIGIAGVVGGAARSRSGARAAGACGRTSAGTWPRRRPRASGKVAMLTRVGTMATPRSAKSGIGLLGEPGRVLDAVDPGRRPGRRSESSAKQCAVTRAPSSWAAAIASSTASRGQHGGQVAGVAVDPVADQLDPAVAAPRLPAHVGGQVAGLDLVRVVADVAAGAGDVAAGPDDPRQVLAVVDPAGVGRRARRRAAAARRPPGRSAPASRWSPRRPRRAGRVRRGSARRPVRAAPSRSTVSTSPRAGRPLVGDPAADHPQLVA